MSTQPTRRGVILAATSLGFSTVAPAHLFAQQKTILFDFEDMPENSAPPGFSTALTGQGGPPVWLVQLQDGAGGKVLTQTSAERTSYRFPLCIAREFAAKDVEVSVRFKPISGRVDQAAGLVWRFQTDADYYVVRANALENNVVLYKVEAGRRIDLKPLGANAGDYGRSAPVPRNAWSVLSVTARETKFTVFLNGAQLFEVEDSTIQKPGRIGLWTKADSVTSFDDLKAASLD